MHGFEKCACESLPYTYTEIKFEQIWVSNFFCKIRKALKSCQSSWYQAALSLIELVFDDTHTHAHTHTHTHTDTNKHTHTHANTYTYTHTHMHTQTPTHTNIHTYTRTYPHTYIHAYIHTRIQHFVARAC